MKPFEVFVAFLGLAFILSVHDIKIALYLEVAVEKLSHKINKSACDNITLWNQQRQFLEEAKLLKIAPKEIGETSKIFASSFDLIEVNNVEEFSVVFRKLYVEALHNLSKCISCTPVICFKQKSFTSNSLHTNTNLNVKSVVALNSYPGSGNTWVRSIIQSGTRIYTGSVFADHTLDNLGFKGELGSINDFSKYKYSAIKMHYPLFSYTFKSHLARAIGGYIHIIRSPHDSMLSEFNRIKSSGQKHKGLVDINQTVFDFKPFYFRKLTQWVSFFDFWEDKDDLIRNQTSNYEIYFKEGIPVLQLFYEDFLIDKTKTLAALFVFLKIFLKDKMPSISESVICALRHTKSEERQHRSGYKKAQLDGLLRHDNKYHRGTKKLCESLFPYWNEKKWGKCSDGLFQKERNDIQVLPVLDIPLKSC